MDNKYLFLEGDYVYLRPFLKKDIRPEYLSWLNDPKMTVYSSSFRTYPTVETDLEEFVNNLKSDTHVVFAACCKETDEHFGNVSISDIDWLNRRCDHGVMIGVQKYRGIHYIDIMEILSKYVFDIINMNKFYGATEIPNIPVLLERMGWNQEGVLKEHNFRNGEYVDVYQMALYKSKYLDLKE